MKSQKLTRGNMRRVFQYDQTAEWWKMSESLLPPKYMCIKCKWVFKTNYNGVYHAKLVMCGYTQVPGIYYFKNYSPIMNDITFGVLVLI